MGVYTRFKREPDGFRHLVELLESTPKSRRDKMINVGMKEDPDYTQMAMQYVLTFQDILEASDFEIAEIVSAAPGRVIAAAIGSLGEDVKEKFLKNAGVKFLGGIKENLETEFSVSEAGGAQLKLIEVTRQLEKRGKVKIKKIPSSID